MSGNGRRRYWLFAAVTAVLAVAVLAAASDLVNVPFTHRQQVYAIGIYTGQSPLTLKPVSSDPVLTRSDIPEPDVIGVADPWLVVDEGKWHIFVEVIRRSPGSPLDQHGVIGLATSEDAGESWRYEGVVLEEPWHLSYPGVFEHEGSFYMVPESLHGGKVALYQSDDFPRGWREEAVLLNGEFVDPTIFAHAGRWWLLASDVESDPSTLRLFIANELSGSYEEHPASPIVAGDVSKGRSAGPVVAAPEGLIRFAQDNREDYGRAVRAFLITTLTTSEYAEEEIAPLPLLTGSGEGWNADGMHHLVPVRVATGEWVASVDGYNYERVFGLDR